MSVTLPSVPSGPRTARPREVLPAERIDREALRRHASFRRRDREARLARGGSHTVDTGPAVRIEEATYPGNRFRAITGKWIYIFDRAAPGPTEPRFKYEIYAANANRWLVHEPGGSYRERTRTETLAGHEAEFPVRAPEVLDRSDGVGTEWGVVISPFRLTESAIRNLEAEADRALVWETVSPNGLTVLVGLDPFHWAVDVHRMFYLEAVEQWALFTSQPRLLAARSIATTVNMVIDQCPWLSDRRYHSQNSHAVDYLRACDRAEWQRRRVAEAAAGYLGYCVDEADFMALQSAALERGGAALSVLYQVWGGISQHLCRTVVGSRLAFRSLSASGWLPAEYVFQNRGRDHWNGLDSASRVAARIILAELLPVMLRIKCDEWQQLTSAQRQQRADQFFVPIFEAHGIVASTAPGAQGVHPGGQEPRFLLDYRPSYDSGPGATQPYVGYSPGAVLKLYRVYRLVTVAVLTGLDRGEALQRLHDSGFDEAYDSLSQDLSEYLWRYGRPLALTGAPPLYEHHLHRHGPVGGAGVARLASGVLFFVSVLDLALEWNHISHQLHEGHFDPLDTLGFGLGALHTTLLGLELFFGVALPGVGWVIFGWMVLVQILNHSRHSPPQLDREATDLRRLIQAEFDAYLRTSFLRAHPQTWRVPEQATVSASPTEPNVVETPVRRPYLLDGVEYTVTLRFDLDTEERGLDAFLANLGWAYERAGLLDRRVAPEAEFPRRPVTPGAR